jgi:hypothetical protein
MWTALKSRINSSRPVSVDYSHRALILKFAESQFRVDHAFD